MFDFFGNGRKKSLDEMMKDLEEMLGSSYNPMGAGYVVGKSSTEKGTDENGDWTKETFTSKDGLYQITSIVRTYGSEGMKPFDSKKKEPTETGVVEHHSSVTIRLVILASGHTGNGILARFEPYDRSVMRQECLPPPPLMFLQSRRGLWSILSEIERICCS